VALRVSADGARVVALLHPQADPGHASVVVAPVVRQSDQPVALGPPMTLLTDLNAATALSFAGPSHVAVLSARPDGGRIVTVVQIGGLSAVRSAPSAAVDLTLRDSGLEMYVGADDGSLWRWSVLGWASAPALRWASFPG
jgi:hypothetical protein